MWIEGTNQKERAKESERTKLNKRAVQMREPRSNGR